MMPGLHEPRVSAPLAAFKMMAIGMVFTSCSLVSDDRPNIVLIVSDDAGYVDFGFTGSTDFETPNLDSLALNGVVFNRAYVTASVCSPSRAGLMTGRYQQRFGHEGNLSDPTLGLPIGERTIADELGDAGYFTIGLGKWHLGYDAPYHPRNRGFDAFFGTLAGSRSYFGIQQRDPGRQAMIFDRDTVPESDLTYLTDDLGRFASEFVDSGMTRPFFMYLAFTAPHTPMQARAEDFERFAHIQDTLRRTNAAMTFAMDRAVGGLVASLKRTGEFDNTLFIFLNDNGGATNNASDNGPWRGMKGSKWEGGVRVPMFVSWRDGIEAGRTSVGLVSALDILPTLLAVARVERTTEAAPLDGQSLLPALTGPGDLPNRHLYWRRYVAASVTDGNFKLVRVDGSDPMLFNLNDSRNEYADVAADHPDVAAELLRSLADWEAGLTPPLWREGERWENNQLLKHRMDVVGRDAERIIP